MIRSEGPEVLVVIELAVAICQHHLYMASNGAPTGRPPGGTEVKVGGPARARTIELIKNPRRQCHASTTSPWHCRLRFLISLTVRALAGPSKYIFHANGPFMGQGWVSGGPGAFSVLLRSAQRGAFSISLPKSGSLLAFCF